MAASLMFFSTATQRGDIKLALMVMATRLSAGCASNTPRPDRAVEDLAAARRADFHSTMNSMRHLFAMAEIAKLKRNVELEVRVMAVPDEWVPPRPGTFIAEVMNNLADLGEKMGADPASRLTEPP